MLTTLPSEDLDRIIEMAWEDRTPFEAIEFQFGLSEPQVIAVMRQQMKASSFKLWRKAFKPSGKAFKSSDKAFYFDLWARLPMPYTGSAG